MTSLDLTLLVFMGVQQFIHYHHTQKLLNKLMSRNYQDYMVSHVIAEDHKTKDNHKIVIPVDEDDSLDGTMNRLGIL